MRPALIMGGGIVAVIGVTLALIDIDFGLAQVPTSLWGGILVTLLVATVGIVFSLPFGILLALGRRSKLPIVRMASVIFIEFVRGVPLITVLIMANTMLPLFLPGDMTVDRLLRPLIGIALFASAYMAEVVRGGLQAMPKGQYEGAMSLGLNYPQMMVLIILPQALRIVIPGIVNTFIGLFKDTSLVAIVGIFDLDQDHRGLAHRSRTGRRRRSATRAMPSRPCSTSSSAWACRAIRSASSGASRLARNGKHPWQRQ